MSNMIVNREEMKAIEAASGSSVDELMEHAGAAAAEALKDYIEPGDDILIIAGKGNNGGDGFVIADLLKDIYRITVMLAEDLPKTDAAKNAYAKLPASMFVKNSRYRSVIHKAHNIVDAVYGFGFRGSLTSPIRKIFRTVNQSDARVFSIDINSGAECDTGRYDSSAVHSDVTFALQCHKPFHMLAKEHGLFRECRLLDLGMPLPEKSSYFEMNEEIFFQSLPKKRPNAYKGTFGKAFLISGSYGMAGAAALNVLGARAAGSSYIVSAVPEEVYPIAASRFLTPVFKPFRQDNYFDVIEPLLYDAKAIGFGSGAVNMPGKDQILDLLLQNARCPVVLDAEALRLLRHNTFILWFVKTPVIVTPHIGEFSDMISRQTAEVRDNPIGYAVKFAKEYHTIVVLKGANTIVAGPAGEIYINQSGNPALAQAGSGDVLTGMITALLTMTCDVYKAVCMAVWLHGHLADLGLQDHSMHCFPLESFPEIMDRFMKEHGY